MASDAPLGDGLRLLLVGLMGCGKSSVGRALAEQLSIRYLDNDQEIAGLSGESTLALGGRGDDALHRWEAAYAQHLATLPGPFVAGLPASCGDRPGELERLRPTHVIVYLRCDVGLLLHRTRMDAPRPWLSQLDPEAFTMKAFAQRDPVFSAAAHHVIEAGQTLTEVTRDVLLILPRATAD